ncbi:MAG TPA: HTH domain-containing protein, partial [Steroidobacteraceae bacterium]|nr:HTH domain-containing protein [Steroidobacteraceae bacterium]
MARSGRSAHPEANDATPLTARVFAQLCDGRFHSGEQLAQALGVSRSAIWKAAGTLRELGATLHAVRNRGYRLASASDPLDAAKIRERLAPEVRDHVRSVEATWSTASTNSVLLGRA